VRGGWRPFEGVALIALPVLFLAAELILRAHALPYWLWFNLDPSYLYLLDGMQVLQGIPPGNVAHPGTPVQTLMALVVWASGLGSPGGISDAAFAGAETLLARASDVMLALDALALLVLGWVVWRRFGSLVPALLAQTAPFLSMLTLKYGIEVEPEPMLLLGVLLLAAALIEQAVRPRTAMIVALGVVIGFGTACKITFAPLGLAPFLLIGGWRGRAGLVAVTVVSFAIFLLPAWGAAPEAARWFGHLALGSGVYGAGPPTVIDPTRYPRAFVKLFFARPTFLVPFFAAVAILLWRRHPGLAGRGPERALFAILAAQLVQILLVAKHPSAHYILPTLELGGVELALLWHASRDLAAAPPARRRTEIGFAAILALLIVAQGIAFQRQDRETAREGAGARSIDMTRDFPACAHVFYDMASSPSQAWIYNMNFGAHPYGARLAALLPAQDYSFLTWVGRIENVSGFVEPAEIAAHYPCIALRGTNLASLHSLGKFFGSEFDAAETCRAGSEYILVAHAPCPGGARS
jgi:hypothetical protein